MRGPKSVKFTEETLYLFQEYLQDEERSAATIDKYLRDVRRFLEYLGEDGMADREKVRAYKQELREGYKITSANSMLAAINSFFAFTGREELKVKLFKVQKVLFCSPDKEMTQKDYKELIQAARGEKDMRMSMLLQTLGSTGIRISELKYITVESLDAGHAEIYNKGKSRRVLIPLKLGQLLRKYCRKAGIQSGSIFVTRFGNPMDRSNINKRMKQLGRAAGVSLAKVFPHNLRHLFARTFYSIEKDVICLMDLMGHSNISTTRIYTASTEDQPRQQMARMNLVLG